MEIRKKEKVKQIVEEFEKKLIKDEKQGFKQFEYEEEEEVLKSYPTTTIYTSSESSETSSSKDSFTSDSDEEERKDKTPQNLNQTYKGQDNQLFQIINFFRILIQNLNSDSLNNTVRNLLNDSQSKSSLYNPKHKPLQHQQIPFNQMIDLCQNYQTLRPGGMRMNYFLTISLQIGMFNLKINFKN